MRFVNTPTGTHKTAPWEVAPTAGSVRSRVAQKIRQPGQEWIREDAKREVEDFCSVKRDKPRAAIARDFFVEHPEFKQLGSDCIIGMIKAGVKEGRIPKENLGKGRQGGARRRLTEADKTRLKTTILREAVNPKNKFKLQTVANAVGISRTVFTDGWASDIAEPEGWDSLLKRAMYSHLWTSRDEHNMDPKAMSRITGRNRKDMENARSTLKAAQNLSVMAREHGKNLPVGNILKRWGDLRNTVSSLRGAASEGEKQRLVRALIDKKVI